MTITREQLVKMRLYSQFYDAERLKELIGILREYVEEIDDIIADVALKRFKDTSEGVWLDWVAEIIGIFTRPAAEYPNEEMFSYRSLSDPVTSVTQGYGTIYDPSTGGRYHSIYGNQIPDEYMNDSDFLATINAKIAANFAESSIPGIWDYIYYGFGTRVDIITSIGRVDIYFRVGEPVLSDFDRRILIQFAPVLTGCKIVLMNWL